MGYYRKVDTATNLLPYSQDFNPNWVWGSIVVTDNAAIAPDGTMTAATVEDADGTDWQKILGGPITVPNDTVIRCASIYVRKEAVSPTYHPRFEIVYDSGGTLTAHTVYGIDLATGSYSLDTFGTPGWEQIYGGLEDAGSYWRVWVAGPNNGTGNVNCSVYFYPAYDTAAATGTIVVWGGQLEVGTHPSPYIPTSGSSATAATRRDNHWVKNHNGVWVRTLLIEQEETNLCRYSAEPVPDRAQWDYTNDFDSWESVSSCIEGGRALKVTSKATAASRVQNDVADNGADLYSGKVEVVSGIFERVDQPTSVIFAFGNPTSNYAYVRWYWTTDTFEEGSAGNGIVADAGYEDLGIGPNGGRMIRLWLAYDSGAVSYSGESRFIQWRVDNDFGASYTGIFHHGQISQYEGGAAEERQNPTSPIVTAGATVTRNMEAFYIPTSLTPQLMTIYVRVKVGQFNETNERLISIGDTSGAGDIYVDMYLNGNNNVVANVNDLNNAWWDAQSSGASFSVGDTIEGRMVFDPDNDQFKAQTAINGVEYTEGAWQNNASISLSGGSFDTQNFWLGGWFGTNDTLCGAFEAAKVCLGEQTMVFMRGYKE